MTYVIDTKERIELGDGAYLHIERLSIPRLMAVGNEFQKLSSLQGRQYDEWYSKLVDEIRDYVSGWSGVTGKLLRERYGVIVRDDIGAEVAMTATVEYDPRLFAALMNYSQKFYKCVLAGIVAMSEDAKEKLQGTEKN